MPAKDGDTVTLRVGRTTLTVEAVVSNAARTQGLSDRRSMPRGHGMIFIFESAAVRGMWLSARYCVARRLFAGCQYHTWMSTMYINECLSDLYIGGSGPIRD
jgi:hypothetical protein